MFGDCLALYRSHSGQGHQELRQSIILPRSVSVSGDGRAAGARCHVARFGEGNSIFDDPAMGGITESARLVCCCYAGVLFAVDLLWRDHHLRVAQSIPARHLQVSTDKVVM